MGWGILGYCCALGGGQAHRSAALGAPWAPSPVLPRGPVPESRRAGPSRAAGDSAACGASVPEVWRVPHSAGGAEGTTLRGRHLRGAGTGPGSSLNPMVTAGAEPPSPERSPWLRHCQPSPGWALPGPDGRRARLGRGLEPPVAPLGAVPVQGRAWRPGGAGRAPAPRPAQRRPGLPLAPAGALTASRLRTISCCCSVNAKQTLLSLPSLQPKCSGSAAAAFPSR